MGIFKKKQIKDLPPLMSDTEIEGASYEQVIDFLTNVNDADFDKIINVAKIYRKAHSSVAGITGLNADPVASIFEHQTIAPMPIAPAAGTLLDDDKDDDLDLAFLDSDPEKPEQPRQPDTTKIEVKAEPRS